MSTDPRALASPRVLVVDDYQDGADSLMLILRALGADARAVYDGETALDVVREFKPDLVFLDLGLPGLSGLEVASAIRESDTTHQITLVALSGRSHDEARGPSLDAGFHDYLMKPVALETVMRVLAASGHETRPRPNPNP
jgi:DNA-binding response OmpR family regulator